MSYTLKYFCHGRTSGSTTSEKTMKKQEASKCGWRSNDDRKCIQCSYIQLKQVEYSVSSKRDQNSQFPKFSSGNHPSSALVAEPAANTAWASPLCWTLCAWSLFRPWNCTYGQFQGQLLATWDTSHIISVGLTAFLLVHLTGVWNLESF